MESTIDEIGTAGVIAILRNRCEGFIAEHLPTLAKAGLRVIEVSRTAEGYKNALSTLIANWGNRLLIGAGTIRSKADAEEAIALGARFLVSPNFDPNLTHFVARRGMPYIVGCYTPSEVSAALDFNPLAIKIFPAFIGGPKYIQSLLAPFPGARFVPTGGIHPLEAPDYWNAGAWAIGIGSEMSSIVGQNGWTIEQLKALLKGKPR